jgi:ATP-dependent protease ClpP protease subunit
MQKYKNRKRDNTEMSPFDDDFDFDFDFGGQKVKKKFLMEKPSTVFYLYDEIGEVKEYIDLIHTLDTAEEGDEIHIKIASPGGYVDTAIAILHAMRRSRANIITHADANVQSAATLIFLAATQYCVYPHSHFMFHHCSAGAWHAKINDHLKHFNASDKLMKDLYQEYYFPILSQTEIDQMIIGDDHWISAEDMTKRLQAADKFYRDLEEQIAQPEPKKKASTAKTKRVRVA